MRVCKHDCDVSDLRGLLRIVLFSNKALFRVSRGLYEHSEGLENSPKLCTPSPTSRVCITVSNSPNPPRV